MTSIFNNYKYYFSNFLERIELFRFWILDKYLILKESSSELVLIVSKQIIFGMIYTAWTLLNMAVWYQFRSWKVGLIIFFFWNFLISVYLIVNEKNKLNYIDRHLIIKN